MCVSVCRRHCVTRLLYRMIPRNLFFEIRDRHQHGVRVRRHHLFVAVRGVRDHLRDRFARLVQTLVVPVSVADLINLTGELGELLLFGCCHLRSFLTSLVE